MVVFMPSATMVAGLTRCSGIFSIQITVKPTSRKADHRDGVTLNNQRHNLRWSTDSQSNANRRLFKNNTSGYRGVYGPNEYGRYLAQLKINKKRYHLGYYGTAEEAARRYDFFARDLFGEFARLNLVSSELGAHG